MRNQNRANSCKKLEKYSRKYTIKIYSKKYKEKKIKSSRNIVSKFIKLRKKFENQEKEKMKNNKSEKIKI